MGERTDAELSDCAILGFRAAIRCWPQATLERGTREGDADALVPMKVALLGPVAWRTPPRHSEPWEQVPSLIAAGLAALLSGKVKPQGKTVVTISGGNVDVKLLADLIEREMIHDKRYMHCFTSVPDRPGGLAA